MAKEISLLIEQGNKEGWLQNTVSITLCTQTIFSYTEINQKIAEFDEEFDTVMVIGGYHDDQLFHILHKISPEKYTSIEIEDEFTAQRDEKFTDEIPIIAPLLLAILYEEDTFIIEAEKSIEEVATVSGNIYSHLARTYLDRGKPDDLDESIEHYNKAINSGENSTTNYTNLALAYYLRDCVYYEEDIREIYNLIENHTKYSYNILGSFYIQLYRRGRFF